MHWGSPVYLNFLILLPVLAIFFIFAAARKRQAMKNFGDSVILEKLSSSKSLIKERWRRVLLISAVGFLIISLARPQIGTRLTMTRRQGVDVMIAIDTSLSMLTEDIKPNRLEKAKLEISSLIDKLKGDRVGILTFAGDSFVQCPLTLDYNAAKMFLGIIEVGMMPKPGTAIGEAIRTATESFIKKERKYKILILLTDGEDHETDPVQAAQDARKEGVIIYTIGIGTKSGEPIPVVDEEGRIIGHKKDKDGNVVLSKLDDAALQKIALVTNGKYYNATPGEFELDKIYDEISKMQRKELSNRLFTQYEDRFQYFLAIALAFLCIEFAIGDRKRK
ncbi:MAG: VWA domain-containing protein [Candidatus Omnitrophica bacterium]|nr:VWA domain-containing protein [Candidatus Omnitrophota bacterium]MBU1933014.1 VWA domain-containing protein [Candidatus Omnitrophota bacterium]